MRISMKPNAKRKQVLRLIAVGIYWTLRLINKRYI